MIPIEFFTGIRDVVVSTDARNLTIVLLIVAVVYLVGEIRTLKKDIRVLTDDVRHDKEFLWKMILQKEPIVKEEINETPRQDYRKTGT